MLNVAIIGAGYGLYAHLPAYQALSGVNVACIVSRQLPTGGQQARPVKHLSSWREALELPIDAVSVAVPPAEQSEIVLAALNRGKHVLCEKPFGFNTAEAKQMFEVSAKNKHLITAINFQYRYEPLIAQLKEWIHSPLTGAINWIRFSWITGGRADQDAPWTWRNSADLGGGVLGAFVSHAADLIVWITGQKIKSVAADLTVLVERRKTAAGDFQAVTAEDIAAVQIRLENDIPVHLLVTNSQHGGDGMRIEIGARTGRAVYQHSPPFNQSDQLLTLSSSREEPTIYRLCLPDASISRDSRIVAVGHLVRCFSTRISGSANIDMPSFADGLYTQRVLAAIRSSAHSGGRLVRVR